MIKTGLLKMVMCHNKGGPYNLGVYNTLLPPDLNSIRFRRGLWESDAEENRVELKDIIGLVYVDSEGNVFKRIYHIESNYGVTWQNFLEEETSG